MQISFIKSTFDEEEPEVVEVADLDALGSALVDHASAAKGGAAWIAAGTAGRTDEHVDQVCVWTLDYDGVEPDWAKLAHWRYIAHTTHSHSPERPSWRVIVDLDEPCVAADWKSRYKGKVLQHDLKASTDGKTCNPARIWYTPGPEAEWRTNLEGEPATMPAVIFDGASLTKGQPDLDDNSDGLLSDGSAMWEHVERCMRTLPPSVSGQGGDDRLFEAACILRASFRLTADATLRALRIFNERCTPPWDEDRLAYKSNQAAGDTQHTRGELIPPDVRAVLLREAPPQVREQIERAAGPFRLISAAEMSEPLGPVNWLVENLGIAPGRPTLFNGYAGSGKTFAAQEIALAVATGGLAFGRFPCRQGSVLHIDVDQGRRATTRRYQTLTQGRSDRVLAELPIDLVVFQGQLTAGAEINQQAVQDLANAVEGRALCIIDSLRGIAPDMDENSSSMGAVLQVLSFITDASDCTFIVLHHEGKPTQGSQRQGKHSGRGSSAIQDRAGAVWRLLPEEETRNVEWSMVKISEHDTEVCKPFRTALKKVDGGGQSLVIANTTGQPNVPRVIAQAQDRIFVKLRKADRWVSRTELLLDLGGKKADCVEALSQIMQQGRAAWKDAGGQWYHWNPKMDPKS